MSFTQQEHRQAMLPENEKSQVSEDVLEQHFQYYLDIRKRQLLAHLSHQLSPSQILRLLRRLGYACTPQLLRSVVWNERASAPKKFPTSYLNGLRGVTAVKVFTFHYTFVYSDFGFRPWGMDQRHTYVLELPIIRYFYSGFTSHVFFGIAGYLTSLRLFQLLERNDATSHSKVLMNVSGSLFRRAFRLYLPVFIITLLTTTYIHLGFYERSRPLLLDRTKLFPGDWFEPKPDMADSWGGQLRHWGHEMFDITNIMTEMTIYPYHDQHLWSILAEMRASLQLYGVLMALAQCRRPVRIILMLFLTVMYFLWNHWEVWVYVLGAIVAQIDILLTEHDQDLRKELPASKSEADGDIHSKPRPDISRPIHEFPNIPVSSLSSAHLRSSIRWLAFLLAFYLLSYPVDGAQEYAPGYMRLNRLIPEWMQRKDKFYPNIGTALLLLLLARSNPDTSRWRKFLDSSIPQYLGRISFSLYLVHGPIMHAFGYLLPHKLCWMLGTELLELNDMLWALAIIFGWIITLTVSLWAADVWAREVEARCTKFVKTLEGYCFVKNV